MKIYAYIVKDFFKFVAAVISLCLFLFVLFDFIHKTTKYFADYKPSAALIAKLYLYQLPAHFVQAIPIASLLASVITMVLLSRTNEITAMRAAGLSPFRLAIPLAFSGVVLSLVTFLMSEFVLPYTSKKMHIIKDIEIEKENESEVAKSALWGRKDRLIVHFREYDATQQKLTGVRVIEMKNQFRPSLMIYSNEAFYQPATKDWELRDCHLKYFNANGTLDYSAREPKFNVMLPIDPTYIKKERREPNEMSARELLDFTERGEKSGADILAYKVDFHLKFAYPFAAFVVSLIGLQFGFKSERKTETAKSILLAFTIGISYWFVLNAMRAVGRRGDIDPMIAAWTPNIFMLCVVYFMSFRVKRD